MKIFLYKQLEQCKQLLIMAWTMFSLKLPMGNIQIDSKVHQGSHVQKSTCISSSQNYKKSVRLSSKTTLKEAYYYKLVEKATCKSHSFL